jgi:hypothetical protein
MRVDASSSQKIYIRTNLEACIVIISL